MTEATSPVESQKGSGAARIVESIKKWSHDHLTLQGREDGIYLKKYAQIAEKLPQDMYENSMALLEMRLRKDARSAAIGSIVVDALMTGGALVGAGVLLNKVDFKFPKFERNVVKTPRPVAPREQVVPPPVPKAKEPARWSLFAFAKKVSRILEGHGEDLDINMDKVTAGADKALDGLTKVKWDAPADWIEQGIDRGGKGLKRLWGWLDGTLGKLADKM
jgi:hypothetical protein